MGINEGFGNNNKGLGGKSPEEIRRLEKLINEIKLLPETQEQLIGKILEDERKVADMRMSSLEEYFSAYEERLNKIADKQGALYNSFIKLEQEIAENIKELENQSSKDFRSSKSADQIIGFSSNKGTSEKAGSESKTATEESVKNLNRSTLGSNTGNNDIRDVISEIAATINEERKNKTTTSESQAKAMDEANAPIEKYKEEIESSIEDYNSLINRLKVIDEHAKEAAGAQELGDLRAKQVTAKDQADSIMAQEKKRIAFIEQAELRAKRKNNGILEAEEAARIRKEAAEKFKYDQESLDKLTKKRLKEEAKIHKENSRRDTVDAVSGALTRENNLFNRIKDLKKISSEKVDGDGALGKITGALDTAVVALSSLITKLDNTIDSIGEYKGKIDTRLQGSSHNLTKGGSYWDQLTRDMMSVGAVTPFFKQSDFAKNIEALVSRGIAFDLKQRAFLMTIQEKIATTFDAADGTLLRLVRLQQEDSTAGRLGMESALNSFLNNMYENTEYLKDVASSVRGSLQEMEALMTGAAATEVEYQVQKWMGSLYSVGMSSDAVQGIANALGQIASGQIDALTSGNGAGNLMVMAANNANISIADVLAEGLDASNTNKLLQATVDYLASIAESSKDNNVVQQQLANVFGVKASDLRAATNLASASTINDIYSSNLSYDGMLGQLYSMAGSMYSRTSMGEMLSNIWENTQYTLAGGIANNPATYAIYKAASLLDAAVGGIPIPDISIMGNAVALNTTVADMLRVGALGSGLLGSIGSIVSGLVNSFDGQKMLNKMGISEGSGLAITPRGTGVGSLGISSSVGGGTKTTSSSGYVGNASGSDVKSATFQSVADEKQQTMIEAQEESSDDNQIDMISTSVVKMYELLENVAKGNQSLSVRVENYGLTNGRTSAQGGTARLLGESGSSSSNDLSGSTSSSLIDLGGWTLT